MQETQWAKDKAERIHVKTLKLDVDGVELE
jgi:hypothetical protein